MKPPEDLFRNLIEKACCGVWVLDLNANTTYLNFRMCELLGESEASMAERSLYEFIDPSFRSHAQCLFRERVSGKIQVHEFQFVRKNGTSFWGLLACHPILGLTGKAKAVAAFIIDISETKSEELERTEMIVRSRAFLDSLIDNIPLQVFVKEAKNLQFVRFNKVGVDLVGFSQEELIGKNDYDFFPKEQADLFVAKDRAVLAGRDIVDIPEESIQTKNQGTRILHTRKIPIFNSAGEPEYLLGISEDITEKKIAEAERIRLVREEGAFKEREKSFERNAFLADASAILYSSLNYRRSLDQIVNLIVSRISEFSSIFLKDESGRLERVAAAHSDPGKADFIERLKSGGAFDNSSNSGVNELLTSGKSRLFSKITEDQLKAETINEQHFNTAKKLDVSSYLSVPILTRGETIGIISFANSSPGRAIDRETQLLGEDLGRRVGTAIENARLYEKAQKAVQLRDEFLSVASHELKTPITSLKLQLQILQRQFKREEVATPNIAKTIHYLDNSIHQVNRLTSLVEDLLDISKFQAGKVHLNMKPVNLADLIRGVIDRYSAHLEFTSCRVVVDLEEGLIVMVDQDRIEQVLENVLSNAIKYAPGTAVEIRLSSSPEVAQIKIQDHGPGIPPEQQKVIFERFARAVSSRNISGLGLGLFICEQIMDAHGGSIKVESQLKFGSAFIVTLPRS